MLDIANQPDVIDNIEISPQLLSRYPEFDREFDLNDDLLNDLVA